MIHMSYLFMYSIESSFERESSFTDLYGKNAIIWTNKVVVVWRELNISDQWGTFNQTAGIFYQLSYLKERQ